MFKSFRQRLRAGEQLLGTLVSLPSPEVAETLAGAGFDWLFIDGEHGAFDALVAQRMLQAVGDRCPCLLRVPLDDEIAIKKALDIGAAGVIVPQVNSAAQARRIVSMCKYPPQGRRGVGLARAHGYGSYFGDYVRNANSEVSVVIQAEHIDAVKNIAEMVRTEGVDAIFIGPYDLAASMGHMGDVQAPAVLDAVATIRAACKEAQVALGIFGLDAAGMRGYLQDGFTLIAAGCDSYWLLQGAKQAMGELTRA
ncbi:MAG: aldolase/citrate lyase family protein [Gammaproteobacteria bacterium]